MFDKWTTTAGTIANATSASTTFTMPASAATVTATYKDAPTTTYALTVVSGTGGGNYAAGATVTISANAAPSGKVFDKWTTTAGTIANATSASTTFTIPASTATVTATYKDASVADARFTSREFSVQYKGTVQLTTNDTTGTKTYAVKTANAKVTVDSNGKVTSTKAGVSFSKTSTAEINVLTNGIVTDTCTVKVTQNFFQWLLVIVLFGWLWY